jgi:hypothetical protein
MFDTTPAAIDCHHPLLSAFVEVVEEQGEGLEGVVAIPVFVVETIALFVVAALPRGSSFAFSPSDVPVL